MARVDLQCGCGHMFFVSDAQLTPQRTTPCPACDSMVKAPAGTKAAAKPAGKPAPKPAPVAVPDDVDVVPATPGGGPNKKLFIIGGAVAAAVLVAVVILIVILSAPKVDYEAEAAKSVEARKKAFEEVASQGTSPAPGKGAKPATPATAAPAKAAAEAPAKAPVVQETKPKAATPQPSTSPKSTAPAQTAPPQAAGGGAISAELMKRVQTELLALHPFYLNLVLNSTDKARVDAVVAAGKGSTEDRDFLQSILAGKKFKAVLDEIALIEQVLPGLEKESTDTLPVDRIMLSDGRPMNCRILEEGTDIVRVSRILASGVGGQVPLRRDNIKTIEKGKGIGTDFLTRWEAALKGPVAGQVEVMGWCRENTLLAQMKLVATMIVRSDPSIAQARVEAWLPPDPVRNAEEAAKGNVIAYQGKNWLAKDLKEKLLKEGYSLLNGQWYFRKEKIIAVPGLFKYEKMQDKPVIINANKLLNHDVEVTYKTIIDQNSGTFFEQPETKYLRRFYAPPMDTALTARIPPDIIPPVGTFELDIRLNVDEGLPPAGTPMKGEVSIFVAVGDPILEASLMTVAEVKAGGTITVFYTTGTGEDEKRTRLYLCDPKESQSHTIPTELIKGTTDVSLLVVIESTAAYTKKVEKRHARAAVYRGKTQVSPAVDVVHHRLIPEYKAVLFPSTTATPEVFRLRAMVGEKAPQLDRLFAANPDILK